MDLEQLLRAVQSGDKSAVAQLSPILMRELHRFVRRSGLSKPEADDVIQDTFVIVLAKLPELPEHPSLRGWVFTVARNRIFAHQRKRQRKLETSLGCAADVAQPDRGPSSELRHQELAGVLAEEVERLDEGWRVVIQNELDGGDRNALAAELGLTPAGYRTRLRRAVGKLSEQFATIFEDLR